MADIWRAPATLEDGDFTADGGAAAMRRILDRGERPDALFIASDLMARGALAGPRQRLSAPRGQDVRRASSSR